MLWKLLRGRAVAGAKFRRQYPIGHYIADFYCAALGLVIEADGRSHLDRQREDREREAYLREKGFTVLRFSNAEIICHPDFVISRIIETLSHLPPLRTPGSPFPAAPLSVPERGRG
jgi:adenine-specific DNA-methyltransferase